jgi:hypothetical protein
VEFHHDITLTTSVLGFSTLRVMTERITGLLSYFLMKPNVTTLAMLGDLLHFEGLGTIEIISQKSRQE